MPGMRCRGNESCARRFGLQGLQCRAPHPRFRPCLLHGRIRKFDTPSTLTLHELLGLLESRANGGRT
jgi:hypothetical protein